MKFWQFCLVTHNIGGDYNILHRYWKALEKTEWVSKNRQSRDTWNIETKTQKEHKIKQIPHRKLNQWAIHTHQKRV